MASDTAGASESREVFRQEPLQAPGWDIQHRRGIVVGIGAYEDLPPLGNAPRDGMSVAQRLEEDYGFHIELLLDGEATRDALDRAIRDDLNRADGATQWVFFFAGHGMVCDGKGYLAPVDGRGDDPRTCLPLADLIALCLESRCQEILIVLDTCHAGQALIRDEELNDLLDPDPGKNRRVRQILCSGNPYEPVRDDGGRDHSAFTQCLLEALEGWAGIHDAHGAVHFRPLLGFLQSEVKRRLIDRFGEGDWQKTLGGSFAGNALGREIALQPRSGLPRIPARIIQALGSGDPEVRIEGLAELADQGGHPDTFRMAVRLAAEHVKPPPERDVAEWARTAKTLGLLARGPAPDVEEQLGDVLAEMVLADPSPLVLHQARKALGRTRPAIQRRAAGRLLSHLQSGPPSLRGKAWQALAHLPAARRELPLRRRLRVPLTRTRQQTAAFGRALVATPARKTALATSLALAVLGCLWLGSSYYLSTLDQSTIVVRAGHPGFKFLPRVGSSLVVTDHDARHLDDQSLALEERLTGSWLRLRGGAFAWGEQIFDRLDPAPAGLAWWRMGESERAFDHLEQGVDAGDVAALEVLGYLSIQSEAAVAPAVGLLVRALQQGEASREKALSILALLRKLRPRAFERGLADLAGAERAALLQALAAPRHEGEEAGRTTAEADEETISALLHRLREGDPRLRLDAARSLAALPPGRVPQPPLVAALAELIHDGPAFELRTDALRLLGSLRAPESRDAVLDVLIATMRDGSDILRELAVVHLLEVGFDSAEGARRALPVLRSLLRDHTPGIRREAAIGALLLAGSRDEDATVAFAEVVRGLGSGDPLEARNMRNALAESFRRASPEARGRLSRRLAVHAATLDVFTVQPFLGLLDELLKRQPDFFPEYVLALTDLLASSDPEGDVPSLARNRLLQAKGLPEGDLAPAFEVLLQRQAGSDERERAAAAEALGFLAAGHAKLSARALPALALLLEDPSANVQAGAARALGMIAGRQPEAVRPLLGSLLAGLKAPSPAVRSACARALRDVAAEPALPARAVPALLAAVEDADPAVRREAAAALTQLGRRMPGRLSNAPARLRHRLARETDPEARDRLASALATLGGGDPAVVRQVLDLAASWLASPDPGRRLAGVWLLGDLARTHAATGGQVLPMLRSSLRDPDPSVPRETLIVLFLIGAEDAGNAARVVDLVGPLLLDPDWPGRWDAIANNLAPLTREQPIVAPRTVRWLRELLASDTLAVRPSQPPLGPTAAGTLVEALALHARFAPEAPWPLVLSPNRFERAAGREVLARLVAEHPERGPEILKRLDRHRRSVHPHVRLSAAQATEMIALLLRTEEVLGKPEEAARWIEVLNNLPRVDVDAAVRLALDKLEPGVRHG